MRSLEGRHDRRQILLSVAILGSDDPSDLTHVEAVALLDTGATTSAISPQIISGLGLISSGKRLLKVATEERMVDRYLFQVGFFVTTQAASAPAPRFPFVFAETNGFAIQKSSQFDAILGMDVLSQCDFQMNRTGSWKIDFG